MRKFFLLVSILFCLYLQGSAQDPAPTPSPKNWQTFAPENDFSVEVPIKLEVEENEDDKAFRYSGKLDDTYFFILSEQRSKAKGTKIGLKYFTNSHALGESVSFGNSKGEKFVFADKEGFFQRAVYIEVADRAYLFHTVSEKNFDDKAKRFLRSLSIRGQTSFVVSSLSPGAPIAGSDSAGMTTSNLPNGGIRGSGVGSGSGGEALGDVTPQVPPANAVGPTQKVKILTKPRALYTNTARVYGVQGSVTLRIIFLANGTIGNVSVIEKLPLGLTMTAIDAAKSITFEPAQKQGVPYTTTITIQYGFTIY